MRRSLYLAGALTLAAGVLPAQQTVVRAGSRYAYDDRDRAAIGVTTSSGGMRDTLGLLVQSVTAGGPADKAGIEEGNRLVSINGVSLRLSAADAGEGDMDGIANRRLIRELEKVKAGDEVELRLWAGGQAKTVKVKTVAYEDLPSRTRTVRRELDDRAVIGLSLSATGSRRDTLGMLVVRVTTDGPAEKAGIIEGDRISAINGVSLRVASEDAGDGYMSSARMNRYRRELAKVSVGEDVELRIVSAGQSKTVRLKPVRAGDLPRERGGMTIIGDGAFGFGDFFPGIPSITIPPTPAAAPRAPRTPRLLEFDGNWSDGVRIRVDPRAQVEIRERAEEAASRAREAARDALERLERMGYDIDRRANEAADAVATPAPPRAQSNRRIASATGGSGSSGYAYGTAGGATTAYAWAPEAQTISVSGTPAIAAAPASYSGNSVAVWTGDDATFMLQGLRLARVNTDLAENLGAGADRGFLVLDTGRRWTGLRAGDVLLQVDGRPVRDGTTARISLDTGDDHSAEVIRDGRRRVVPVDVR
jgi:serine protease Do